MEVKEVQSVGMKPIKFHRASPSSSSETHVKLEEDIYNELMELPVGYYSPCVQKLVQQGFVPKQMPKDKLHLFEKLWNTKGRTLNSKGGVGFGTVGPVDDSEFCMVVTSGLEEDCLDIEDDSEEPPPPRNMSIRFAERSNENSDRSPPKKS